MFSIASSIITCTSLPLTSLLPSVVSFPCLWMNTVLFWTSVCFKSSTMLQMQFILFWSRLVPLCPFLSYPNYPGVIFWISYWKLGRIEVVLAFEWIHQGPELIEWSVKTNKQIMKLVVTALNLWVFCGGSGSLFRCLITGEFQEVEERCKKGCFFLNAMAIVKS